MDVLDAIQRMKPCRFFQTAPVSEEVLKRVLNAARLSPSIDDKQPWRFLVIRDEVTKEKLSQLLSKGAMVRSAPVIVVAIAAEGESPSLVGGLVLSHVLDVAVSIENLSLAATAEGLGIYWITDFKADRISRFFNIPEGFQVVGILPMGVPLPEAPGAKPPNGRKSLAEVTAYERFPW
ncbi:MAG: nitroreductase family protein [Candidatus Thermoplasmatota archaeon]|jgi:nitroreductase|nr:nitroreductase family protein [Candidatus Thermoplasmatota archaeon]